MKKFLYCVTFLSFVFLFSTLALAKEHSLRGRLSLQEIERVKVFKKSIEEVDQKSLQQTIAELEKTDYPHLNLELKEAMAKAYVDIVQEQNVRGVKKKEWLYSMVALNMAYLQFAGQKDSAAGAKNLNKLIRYKLKEYLPADIFTRPGFHCSIG